MKALIATGVGSAAQASSLGVAGNHIRDFRYLEGTQESPDDFWLCDLADDKEVEVDGPPEVYVMSYASSTSRVETVAGQELYAFSSDTDARQAMKAIRKAAKQCAGTFTVQEEGVTFSQKVSNGTGKASNGSGFTWITQDATVANATSGLAEYEYNTFRRVGQFIQLVAIEVAGPKAPKLTSSQVKAADRLTGTLGSYWAW